MKKSYTNEEIRALAVLAAADYAAACNGPTIRGKNGEKHLRGTSLEEVAKANDMTLDEVAALTVDLSTATFEELPPHWQAVNIDSAEGMIALMKAMGGESLILALDLRDTAIRNHYGAILHQLWLDQPANSWAKGGDLDKPFSALPKEEQDKDIQQLMSLQKWLIAMQMPERVSPT